MLIRIRTLAVVALLALTAALTTQTVAAQAPPRALKCGAADVTITWDGHSVDRLGHRIIEGTSGDDVIQGTSRSDIIYGDGGDDLVCALGGDDIIYGDQNVANVDRGFGNDVIYGGAGTDLLVGDAGNDLLNGGGGHDVILGDSFGMKKGTSDRAYGGTGSDWCRDDNERFNSCEVIVES